MNKRILSVLLVAVMAAALVVGAIAVSAADVSTYAQLESAAERGRDVKLDGTIKPGTTDDGKIDVLESVTIDLNGYKIEDVTFTVAPGVTLTIKDSYKKSLENGVKAVVLNGEKDKVAKLVVASGSVTTVEGDEYSEVTVEGGSVGTISEVATATVSGGKVASIETADVVNVKGGEVAAIETVVDEKAEVTVTGGTVTELTVNAEGEADIKGGTVSETVVEKDGSIEIYAGAMGDVDIKEGGDFYMDGGYIWGDLTAVDDKLELENGRLYVHTANTDVLEQLDGRHLAYAKATLAVVTHPDGDKSAKLGYENWYLIGANTIKNTTLRSLSVATLDKDGKPVKGADGKDEVLTDADTLEMIYNTDVEIDITAKGAEISVTTVKDYEKTNKAVKVNGYALGSDLQKGDNIHDWNTTLIPATPAGTRDCSKEYVLLPYFEDKNNETVYGKPDADGKLAGIYDNSKETVKTKGHSLTFKSAQAATATTPGYDAYLKCDNCGQCFAIELLTTGVNLKSVPVDDAKAFQIADPIARNPVDTTAAPADTTKAPEETTKAPEETTKAPEETTKAPETQAPTPVNPSETGDNGMNALVWVIVLGAAITGVAVAGKSVLASKKH